MMNNQLPITIAQLENAAINAAKKLDWPQAIESNQEILNQDDHNVPALMRLGVAQLQVGKKSDAKKAFTKVLEIDKTNQLAKKHLEKLKKQQDITLTMAAFHTDFIEEPGKTKTVELHRLAGKDVLSKTNVGSGCDLKPKSRFISVECDQKYLGSLPEDVSARLTKLIQNGNQYCCTVQSVTATSCSVFLKETKRSAKNEFTSSFPTSKSQAALNEMMDDEAIALQMDDVKVEIVYTDDDQGDTDAAPGRGYFPNAEETAEDNHHDHQEPEEDEKD